MKNTKIINKKELKELIDPETFAYQKGDGHPGLDQVTAKHTTDRTASAVTSTVSSHMPAGMGTGIVAEDGDDLDKIVETIFNKLDKKDTDIVEKRKDDIADLKALLKKIDFTKVSDEIKDDIIKLIKKDNG